MDERICITPYKELHGGNQSIFDYVNPSFTVPDKVILYLKTTMPYAMSPGIYKHPFRPNVRLLGPYLYTDGKHVWDRDTWKYVLKYNLTLPQEFIDHVMSEAGEAFLEVCSQENPSWKKTFQTWRDNGTTVFLPDDAGDNSYDEF